MLSPLTGLLDSIERPRIAVVGDAILDEYVWGEVNRVSPEAPIPVLRATRRELRAGGAGSVVVNLAALGAGVTFFSVCGDDDAARKLRGLVPEGVDLDGLVVEYHRPTTVKTRHIGFVQHANRAMQQLLRVDDEVNTPLREETIDEMVSAFKRKIDKIDVVLVSDYNKGLISETLLGALREAAPEGVLFVVDPAQRKDYSLYRRCFLMCPNRYEAQSATGIPCRDIDGCAEAARKLADDLELQAVALTMDADGIYVYERDGLKQRFPTRSRVVTDVTGAGDMVLSVLGLVIASKASLSDAVSLANVAAGLEIRRLGVTPLSRKEIQHEILCERRPGTAKIKTLEEVVALVEKERVQGKTVVFTNGCFDLLHFGHYHLFYGAAQEGDILVVAVNSDESVRRLGKGPNRPVIPQHDRMLMIAGFEVVNYVVGFDEETPERLLRDLRPEVLVKGEEYRHRGVVGGDFVESYGGRIVFVSQIQGVSTTALLDAAWPPGKPTPEESSVDRAGADST